MLQSFLQIPDQSTATRRGRFHFKETSFHDAETPLFSTVNFHDAETPLFSTVDLHAAETPPFNTLDLLLMPNHHRSALLTFLCCRNTTVSNPPLSFITETPNSHLFPPSRFDTLFATPSPSFIDETTPSNNCFAFPLLMLKHHCSALLTFSPMLKHHCSTLFFSSHSQNTTVHHFLTIFHRRNNSVQQLFRLFFFRC
jgi:hypothetical protein